MLHLHGEIPGKDTQLAVQWTHLDHLMYHSRQEVSSGELAAEPVVDVFRVYELPVFVEALEVLGDPAPDVRHLLPAERLLQGNSERPLVGRWVLFL